jgi:hypothetical protein
MTVAESIKEAVRTGDAKLAGRMVDLLRFKKGASYEEIYRMAHRLTGISPDDWEQLMYEADAPEGDG